MAEMNHIAVNPKAWTPEELAQIEADAMDDDVFADRVFEQLEAAPPILEKGVMLKLEELIQKDQMRRFAFACMTIDGKKLCDDIANDREFAVIASGLSTELGNIKGRYQALVELFNELERRLILALCSREDMEQVIEEGKSAVFQ